MSFFNFLNECRTKPPKWWWYVSLALAGALLWLTLRGIPVHISQHWCWWYFFVTSLGFTSILYGAFVLTEERQQEIVRLRPLAISFKAGLGERCSRLISEWSKLDRLYLESPAESKGSATLQDPLDPAWVGSGLTVWPYKVGSLQMLFAILNADMTRAGITVPPYNFRIQVPELLILLQGYADHIRRLQVTDAPRATVPRES